MQRFWTQDDALKASAERGLLPVFAEDKPNDERIAKKYYWTGGYRAFVEHILGREKEQRCFYEVLLPRTPCDLHIDAEYNKTVNEHAFGGGGGDDDDACTYSTEGQMEKAFLSLVEEALMRLLLPPTDAPRPIQVLVQDASNEQKFSRHYIFRVNGARFLNNLHCGAFMRRFQRAMISKFGEPKKNPFFFKTGTGTGREFVADMCIYTKHRVFRLLGCTKWNGKYRPMKSVSADGTCQDGPPTSGQLLTSMLQREGSLTDCNDDAGADADDDDATAASETLIFKVMELDGGTARSEGRKKNNTFLGGAVAAGDTSGKRSQSSASFKTKRKQADRDVGTLSVWETLEDILTGDTPEGKAENAQRREGVERELKRIGTAVLTDWDSSSSATGAAGSCSDPLSYDLTRMTAFYRTPSRRCQYRGERLKQSSPSEHPSNHVFIRVDLSADTYRVGCHSHRCATFAAGQQDRNDEGVEGTSRQRLHPQQHPVPKDALTSVARLRALCAEGGAGGQDLATAAIALGNGLAGF